MKLQSLILSEISSTEDEKYCMISLLCGILKKQKQKNSQTHRDSVEKWLPGSGGWEKSREVGKKE